MLHFYLVTNTDKIVIHNNNRYSWVFMHELLYALQDDKHFHNLISGFMNIHGLSSMCDGRIYKTKDGKIVVRENYIFMGKTEDDIRCFLLIHNL